MTQDSDRPDPLKIALSDTPEADVRPETRTTVRMIRTLSETIRLDHVDPVPTTVIDRAVGLSAGLERPPSWFDRAVATVLAPLFDDGPRLAMGLRGDTLRQCTFGVEGFRLDLEVEPLEVDDPDAGRPTQVRGQIDGEEPIEPPIEIAVLLPGTNHLVTTAKARADGRFDLVLDAGTYELAFRLGDRSLTVGSIEIP